MRKKAIKKTNIIPEIICGILLVLLIIGFANVTKKLHSNSVYDGNYIGGNSTDAFANVDVKWISSVTKAPGVDKILIDKNSNWTEEEIDNVLNEDGWFLINYKVKANMSDGYYEREVENLLIQDSWTSKERGIYFLNINDGAGILYKTTDYESEDATKVYPIKCDMHFSNNGACFYIGDPNVYYELYLEKNGELTAYNYQIAQACLICAIAIIGLGYIIFAFAKTRAVNIAVIFVIITVVFIYTLNVVRDNSIGEWRAIENDDAFVLYPKHDEDQYIKFNGNVNKVGSVNRVFQEEFSEAFDTNDKEFKDEYKRFDVIPGYFSYPLILCLDMVAGIVLGIMGFENRKKNGENVLSGVNWSYPYGEYDIAKVKYLSDAFKGMEDYFMANMSESKVKFLLTCFAFEDVEIENPQYVDEYKKACLYAGAPEEKMHILTIKDLDEEIDYDICVTKKGMYIRKKMENEILIVYEI